MYFNINLIMLLVCLLPTNRCSFTATNEQKQQLNIDQERLNEEKAQMYTSNDPTDVIRLNVGGELRMTTRHTLTRVPNSYLAVMFNGRWELKLARDANENLFLDVNPLLFDHLLEQLRTVKNVSSPTFDPPLSPALAEPFGKMLRKLGFVSAVISSREIITLNVGGEQMITRQSTFTGVRQSKLADIILHSKRKPTDANGNLFVDQHPQLFRHLLNQLREQKQTPYFKGPLNDTDLFNSMLKTFDLKPLPTTTSKALDFVLTERICAAATWAQNGSVVAGGNGPGSALNQLDQPRGLFLDDDNSIIYIADKNNHRILKWPLGASFGQIVAGGNGNGSRNDQLASPNKVIVQENGDMFICDYGSKRVYRWLKNDSKGEIIYRDNCWGLAMDNNDSLYITDDDRHQVTIWPSNEVVAGGNGRGNALNQLAEIHHIFVDKNQSVFVADSENTRIVQWSKGAKEGVIVVDGKTPRNTLPSLELTSSLVVDRMGTIYIVDWDADSVTRWWRNGKLGDVILGGRGRGDRLDQFYHPSDIVFDRHGNLYVSDTYNHRILLFLIDKSSCT